MGGKGRALTIEHYRLGNRVSLGETLSGFLHLTLVEQVAQPSVGIEIIPEGEQRKTHCGSS